MGWSESGERCMKHPNTNQTPGVCSSCLREKLSQLCVSNNMKTAMGAYYYNNTSLSQSPSSSSSTYDEILPASSRRRRHHHHHHRNVSEAMGSISFMLNVGSGLKKSRSLAFVTKAHDFGDVKSGKKKHGFWSKLLWSKEKRNKDQVFMHSNTVRERLY